MGLKLGGAVVGVIIVWLVAQWILGIVGMLFNVVVIVALVAGVVYLYRLFTKRS